MKRPFIPIVLAFAAGLCTAHHAELGQEVVVGCGAIAFILLVFGTVCSRRMLATFAALFVFWGAGYISLQRFISPHVPPTHITHFITGSRIAIEGVIKEPPARFPDRIRLRIQIEAVHDRMMTTPSAGTLQLSIKESTKDFRYGDRIRCFIIPHRPRSFANPGGFDYARYLAYHGIHATAFLDNDRGITIVRRGDGNQFRHHIEHFRACIRTCIDQHVSGDAGAVLKAMIIGEQSSVPDVLRDKFSRFGIAHILAISGLHVGIVALISYGIAMWLLRRSERILLMCNAPKLAATLSVFPILLYCCIAGMTIPTLRATIMILCYLIALLLDRQQDLLHTLFVAAGIILVLMPTSLFDVSFQLSFAAVFWLIVLVPAWQRALSHPDEDPFITQHPTIRRYKTALRDLCLVSVAAGLGTAPIVATYFNYASLAGFAANIVVVPLASFLIVPAGLLGAALLPIGEPLGTILIQSAGWITHLLVWMVTCCAAIPGIAFPVATPSMITAAGWYGLLGYSALCVSRKRIKLLLGAVLLFAGLQIFGLSITSRPTGKLTITFLDVGAGDAAVVEFPNRHVMLIDGAGSYSDQFDPGRLIIAPFLYSRGITRIDTMVLTHPHRDHAGGLPYIAMHFKPKEIWYNGEPSIIEPVRQLMEIAQQKGIELHICTRQSFARNIGNTRIDILNPPFPPSDSVSVDDTNNNSLVMKISYGTVSVLMAADILQDREQELVDKGIPLAAAVLKVPHHGGKASSSQGFLAAVHPHIAVASCKNSIPEREITERYRAATIKLLTTAEHGAVTVTTDGQHLNVLTFREGRRFSRGLLRKTAAHAP
ncbi:MAG: DNA internalization-related competence protein ComEC/Rec2 [Desulfobacterota bacterium]|nr:DNA internalization-related competence protein ComEC/Rec2 [Thermodesulfobacteriota bacterium]